MLLLSCTSNDTQPPGLTGYVTSSGTPVENASVALGNNSAQYSTSTGSDGKFQFKNIASGEYILTVKSEQQNSSFIQFQRNVTISSTNQTQSIELPKGVTLLDPSNITNSSIDLKWGKSQITDFLEYKLYRHNTSGLDESTGTLIHVTTSVNDTAFVDTGLSDSQDYYYRVLFEIRLDCMVAATSLKQPQLLEIT